MYVGLMNETQQKQKDIRLVIHSDIPGSPENYLQEAGRAGRDQYLADCILLYEQDDIDSQFSLKILNRNFNPGKKRAWRIFSSRTSSRP